MTSPIVTSGRASQPDRAGGTIVAKLLVATGLLCAALYPWLRSAILNTPWWGAAIPMVLLAYAAARLRSFDWEHVETLDILIGALAAYGVLMGGIALVFGAPVHSVLRVFFNAYLPLSFYLGARVSRFNWRWLLASAGLESAVVVGASGQLGLDPKEAGFYGALLFALFVPYVASETRRTFPLIFIAFGLLLFVQAQGNDTVSLVTLVLVAVPLVLVHTRTQFQPWIAFSAVSLLVVLPHTFAIVHGNLQVVTWSNGTQATAIDHIASGTHLVRAVANNRFATLLLGAQVTGAHGAWNVGTPSSLVGPTELRIVYYPLFFGVGWAALVLAIGAVIITRFWRQRSPQNLAMVCVMVLILLDVHYPTLFRHGVYELVLTTLGTLVPVHEKPKLAPLVIAGSVGESRRRVVDEHPHP